MGADLKAPGTPGGGARWRRLGRSAGRGLLLGGGGGAGGWVRGGGGRGVPTPSPPPDLKFSEAPKKIVGLKELAPKVPEKNVFIGRRPAQYFLRPVGTCPRISFFPRGIALWSWVEVGPPDHPPPSGQAHPRSLCPDPPPPVSPSSLCPGLRRESHTLRDLVLAQNPFSAPGGAARRRTGAERSGTGIGTPHGCSRSAAVLGRGGGGGGRCLSGGGEGGGGRALLERRGGGGGRALLERRGGGGGGGRCLSGGGEGGGGRCLSGGGEGGGGHCLSGGREGGGRALLERRGGGGGEGPCLSGGGEGGGKGLA